MNVVETKIPGLVIIEPKVYGDDRGYFLETWNRQRYKEAGIPGDFVQDNLSFSAQGVLRGLHFQNPRAQGKLVYVLAGEVYDVAVDIRQDSPTFGQWESVKLSAQNKRQFFIPEGFAHGFCVVSETALFAYKCTDIYSPADESTVIWNDPDIGIPWPLKQPVLSEKDKKGLRLQEISQAQLPRYT